tara:strand:- start:939 stop:1544 length:606 start_codon:yes stop_codon:yes gene_type:complete
MALSKIQSESINLADTFAFTGTVSGAGSQGLVHLETQETSTAVTEMKFGSDVFNTTYDRYVVKGRVLPTADANDLQFRFMNSSETDLTASNSYRESVNNGSSANRTNGRIARSIGTVANAETGVLFHLDVWLPHVGNTDFQAMVNSNCFRVTTDTDPRHEVIVTYFRFDQDTTQPAGMNFRMSSNNMDKALISVFGVSETG